MDDQVIEARVGSVNSEEFHVYSLSPIVISSVVARAFSSAYISDWKGLHIRPGSY
ncbi:MAG: hypothetical protein M0Z81_02640 [Deltaproteobacteria bacterium]|nr:hypothetical protein [Deltaproteobacteria bacterium]